MHYQTQNQMIYNRFNNNMQSFHNNLNFMNQSPIFSNNYMNNNFNMNNFSNNYNNNNYFNNMNMNNNMNNMNMNNNMNDEISGQIFAFSNTSENRQNMMFDRLKK